MHDTRRSHTVCLNNYIMAESMRLITTRDTLAALCHRGVLCSSTDFAQLQSTALCAINSAINIKGQHDLKAII